jgi:hypothetical protein
MALSAIDTTLGGALVPPAQQGRKRIRQRLGQSKTLLTLGKSWYEAKGKGTCKPGQNPTRDGCTAATEDAKGPSNERANDNADEKISNAGRSAERTARVQAVPEEKVDTSDPQFEKEWTAEVEKHLAEVEANDVAQFPFDAQQVAAEQDWHSQYIEWRWGLLTGGLDTPSNQGKFKPNTADIGTTSRFISGLLNPIVGGAKYVASLYDKLVRPRSRTHKPADPKIGEELQAYFDKLSPNQDNKQTAELVAEVIGPAAVPVAKALAAKAPEPLTQEQLMAMTPAERSQAVAAERAARQRPTTELRQAAGPLTKPSKPNVANRVQLAQRRAQGKEKKRQNETPEQRTARIAKERAAFIARRKKQEARMAKYREQDRKAAEKARRQAGKKGSKTLGLLMDRSWWDKALT